MNSHRKSLIFTIFFSLFLAIANAQTNPTGTDLCDSFYNYLVEKNHHPQAQSLVSSGINTLPYNIIVNFPAKDTVSDDNLIFVFNMNEAYEYRDLYNSFFSSVLPQNFNISFLFSYGDNTNIPGTGTINGASVFVKSLNTNDNNSVFIFNLSSQKNSIIAGNKGYNSPSWMLKDLFDAFSKAKMTENLPFFYVSQISDYSFTNDEAMLSFIEDDIPCILGNIQKTIFNIQKNSDNMITILNYIIESYEKSRFEIDDSHSFMFRLFGKRIWLSEYKIIYSLILVVFLSLIFLFSLRFINKSLQNEGWQEIKNNWHTIPVIFVLSLIGFFIGKGINNLVNPDIDIKLTAFGSIVVQISFAAILISLFYLLELSVHKKYSVRSFDFLIVLTTFFNQFIFSLIDISLFPLFFILSLISIISLISRRNWVHIILFIFLTIPFIPYVSVLFKNSNIAAFQDILKKSYLLPFVMSLVLLPHYLLWLRILTAMKKRFTKIKAYVIAISSTYIGFMIILIIINLSYFSSEDKIYSFPDITPIENNEALKVTYSDKMIFDDLIRNIKIESENTPVYIGVTVSSEDSSPVLYSENEYTQLSNNISQFLIPVYPSSKLEFNYGSSFASQIITVSEIYYSNTDEAYYLIEKKILIEGNK